MSGMWLGKGDANHGRERGSARARGSKRKLGVMSWGKGLKNIGLEGRRYEEEEEVKRREVAVLKIKVEEEMEKEDKVDEELLVKNTPPLSKFAHICKTVRKKEERKNLKGFADSPDLHYHSFTLMKIRCCGDF